MKVWGEPVSRSATHLYGAIGVSTAMYCNLGSKRNVVERHSTPDEAEAVFWQRTTRDDASSNLQTFLALMGRRVREIGRTLQKRTLANAGRT